MSATILIITALVEFALYLTHRASVADTVTAAHVLRRMESRQATARAYSRPVPYAAPVRSAEQWAIAQRATDDRRAVIGSGPAGAVWNANSRFTR